MASEDEDYFLPPEQQRPFSSGIRRKPVQFVRSSDLDTTTAPTPSSSSGTSIADKYLSIVMGQPAASTSPSTPTQRASSPPIRTHSAPPTQDMTQDIIPPPPPIGPAPAPAPASAPVASEYCEVCKLPIPKATADATDQNPRPHESSLAHQICLTHSHPPSHLDRTRSGLRYLSTYGWDPDSRLGLGASGREGIREPIKPRAKHGTAGLGTGLDRDGDPLPPKPPPVKVQKLNAKQVRNKIAEDKKRAERIRKAFYQNDEVLKYLGEGA
ncbi:D111/G-patch [Penicillium camemberti]|uniref:D111/G-patch n=1 Tax=Penicillium camemberti (strain FM 013) TaxID=1429867 RepID=A0A0G4PSQ6_PENC3|nr:D111/G-patch [Penicillium camemberti]